MKNRNWLVDVTLRAIGGKSEKVKSDGLSEYLPSSELEEDFSKLLDKYGQTEESQIFTAGIEDIEAEFRFNEKFPDQERPDLRYCVVPAEELRHLFNGSGALVKLPEDKRAILINGSSYINAFVDKKPASRGFVAHELGHTRTEELIIGNNNIPLGHFLNELYAEWCGDDNGGYYDEKHMSNFLSTTGLNIRKDYLPKFASGEISAVDLINSLKEQFGSFNTLRILSYAPENYGLESADSPASIANDCIDYALRNNKTTEEELQESIYIRYKPETAKIVLSNPNISRIIPNILRPMIEQRANE